MDEVIKAIKNQCSRVIGGLIPFTVNRLSVVELGIQGGYLMLWFSTWDESALINFLSGKTR